RDAGDRLYEARVIVSDVADARAHRPADHLIRRRCFQDRGEDRGALVRGRAEQAQRPVLAQGVVLSEKLRGRTDPSRAFGGIRRATNRLTAPAYWKFESSPLQQTVRLSPDFASVRRKAPVFRHFYGHAGRQRRQRRAKSRNIAPRRGSVSV